VGGMGGGGQVGAWESQNLGMSGQGESSERGRTHGRILPWRKLGRKKGREGKWKMEEREEPWVWRKRERESRHQSLSEEFACGRCSNISYEPRNSGIY